MGIRESLNKNPAIATGATIGILILALAAIVWQVKGGSSGTPALELQVYFTVDDGATYFADAVRNHAPYQKDGKTAVRAYVYSCDGGKTPFVAYLERYTPAARKQLDEAIAKGQPPDNFMMQGINQSGVEVKLPKTGDKGWVKYSDMNNESVKIVSARCSDGSTKNLEQVIP